MDQDLGKPVTILADTGWVGPMSPIWAPAIYDGQWERAVKKGVGIE